MARDPAGRRGRRHPRPPLQEHGALQGRIFAKTGTLNQVSGLAGYMIAKSGRTLTFAAYANDIPDGAPAVPAIDAALELVASEN